MKAVIATISLLISMNGFSANAIAKGSYDTQDSASQRLMNRSKVGITADQQGMSKADTETTRLVRQAIMKDPALSMEAQNIKIITVDGKVTLRGVMSSTIEINSVVEKARAVAGAASVSNQINLTSK